jgi:hypothetical protein
MTIAWGTITWYFFHTLAEKIKEESFAIKKNELLKLIFSICNNLPCPECQAHAVAIMKNIKPNSINTKEDLQKMLWNFHNFVNKRRRVKQYDFDHCKETFSKAKLNVIEKNFYMVMSQNYQIMKLMGESFKRSRNIESVKKWMRENYEHFEE